MTLAVLLTAPPTRPQARLSAGTLSLLKQRGHRFATCWRLERADGLVLRFTDHNKKLVITDHPTAGIDGTYTPAGGFENTATERKSNLQERNFDIRGIISSDAITHDDLRAGLYRNAEVIEFAVDWRYPWELPLYLRKYFAREIASDGGMWEAKMVGLASKLRERTGALFSRNCKHELGEQGIRKCNIDLTGNDINGDPYIVTGTVSSISHNRYSFASAILSGARADAWFAEGLLTWITGANASLGLPEWAVKTYYSAGGRFELYLRTPYNIALGDTFTVKTGCDHLSSTCKTKFENIEAYGGFQFIPGTDSAFETPNAK